MTPREPRFSREWGDDDPRPESRAQARRDNAAGWEAWDAGRPSRDELDES
jgi:hypothetical protein